ncbi:hypothetical protein [Streptomyces erythrochromogenes]|uniref:hypothetical protein n=1 Tax=Streptomyces erythrochromogenes TaxID=285574 RepID=UPI003685C0BF
MSEFFEFPMQDDKGGVLHLDDLLSLVPDNDWTWSVLEFDGIGHGPAGQGYAAFREKVNASPQGYVMSWPEVAEFSAGIRQYFDLILVAVSNRDLLSAERLEAQDFGQCLVVFTAGDSAWWAVQVDEVVEAASGLVAGLRARYGAGQ